MRLTVSEIMAATGADADIRSRAGVVVAGATNDSRRAGPESLFVCLKGEKADGHDFAAAAVAAGCPAVLAGRPLPELDGWAAVLVADDPLAALGRLGRFWRRRARPVVAALTGSAGKTTAKELLASIAARLGRTIKNPGNWNNQLGLPLSMLAASEEDRIWVLEAGISRLGDMEELGAICEPDLAVVHNIGPAHLEGLGDLAGVARAKATLLRSLRPHGAALVSRDYPLLWQAAREIFPEVRAMSVQDESATYFAAYQGTDERGLGIFRLRLDGTGLTVRAPLAGAHLAENVLAAAAAAHVLGASPEDIAVGLAGAELPDRRFRTSREGSWTVVDDTYNANPLSMRRAIETVRDMAGEKPVVLVLGEMGELGDQAGSAHEDLGRCIAEGGCRMVFFRGDQAGRVEAGLKRGGYRGEFAPVATPEEFGLRLEHLGLDGGLALFKGSRAQRMEDFLDAFLAKLKGGRP